MNADAVTVAGAAEANSLVRVYRDANNNLIDAGELVVATQQLTGGATAYTILASLDANADNNFLVTAVDAAGSEAGGGVAVLFNPDGTRRLTVEAFPGATGGVRVTTADLDGDTRADLIAGAGSTNGDRIVVYLGKDVTPDGTPPTSPAFNTIDSSITFGGGVFVG